MDSSPRNNFIADPTILSQLDDFLNRHHETGGFQILSGVNGSNPAPVEVASNVQPVDEPFRTDEAVKAQENSLPSSSAGPAGLLPLPILNNEADPNEKADPDDVEGSEDSPEPAENFYQIKNWGTNNIPSPINEAVTPAWGSLKPVQNTVLDDLMVSVGDTVLVCCDGNADGLAKVSEFRALDDNRYLMLVVWYYTRADIEKDLRGAGKMPESRLQDYLNSHWPADALYEYMLSSHRDVTVWDAMRGLAGTELTRLCRDKVYVTNGSGQKICDVTGRRVKWMKRLLELRPMVNERVIESRV